MNISKETGRVSAFKFDRYIDETRSLETIYLPQFELIEYDSATGNTIKESFVCIHNDAFKSGAVECKTEIEALQYALEYRDNLNF